MILAIRSPCAGEVARLAMVLRFLPPSGRLNGRLGVEVGRESGRESGLDSCLASGLVADFLPASCFASDFFVPDFLALDVFASDQGLVAEGLDAALLWGGLDLGLAVLSASRATSLAFDPLDRGRPDPLGPVCLLFLFWLFLSWRIFPHSRPAQKKALCKII